MTIQQMFLGAGAAVGGWQIVDSVYVYKGGTIYGISDIPSDDLDLLPNNTALFIRYNLYIYGGTQQVTAAAIRNGSLLSQSGLATANFGNVAYDAQHFCQWTSKDANGLTIAVDDNDGLVMDGNGNFITPAYVPGSSSQYNFVEETGLSSPEQNWAYGEPGTTSSSILESYDPWNTPKPNSNQATLLAFPVTGFSAWVEPWDDALKAGKSGAVDHSRQTGLGIYSHLGSPTTGYLKNVIWTISDSINGFFIGKWGTTAAKYIEVNLTNGQIYASQDITFSAAMDRSPNPIETEEDPFSDQLFAVNGAISYYGQEVSSVGTTNFISGGTTGWRNIDGQTDSSDCNVFSASSQAATQTGMDVISGIDSSRRVYFGDWGHDDGGMFGYTPADSKLGMRRTNIRRLTTNSTPASP